jgi:hypothetical protein
VSTLEAEGIATATTGEATQQMLFETADSLTEPTHPRHAELVSPTTA